MWKEILKRQWTVAELITLVLSRWSLSGKVTIDTVYHYEAPYLRYTITLEEKIDG